MALNEFNFEHLSIKASVQVLQNEKKRPFKANIRIRKDSAIWISITPALGIEVARILITKDTVKVINRFDRNYFIGDYAYINKRFDIELEFNLIQSMLVGNSISFEKDEKVKLSVDKEKYYLGNLKKRKARKADNKPQKIERQKEEVISLWVDQYNFKIRNFIFSDLLANRFLTGEYKDFKSVGDQLIANDLKFDFQSEKPAKVALQYSKVSLEGPLKFSFNISSKYEQVYY
ncbi:MAG: DUF4292 domain-containing protein [Flavobacteriales bacterium]|nr:DUF4292 domain-containing protein [Flavobacteriales bacterium]